MCWILLVLFVLRQVTNGASCEFPFKSTGVPRFEPKPCSNEFNLSANVKGFCGVLVAPEIQNRKRGANKVVRLPVLRLCRASGRLASDAVVFVHGGPGLSAIDTFSSTMVREAMESVVHSTGRDLILYDQRGGLLTTPSLSCNDSTSLITDNCVREMKAKDIEINTYNSKSKVADLESLRKSFFLRRINVIGSSYGTVVSNAYAREHNGRLRSLTLFGAMWPSLFRFRGNGPRSFEDNMARVIRDCEKDRRCSKAFPALSSDYETLLNHPNKTSHVQEIDSLLSLERSGILSDKSIIPLLISLYANLIRGDSTGASAMALLKISNNLAPFMQRMLRFFNFISMFLINCYDGGRFMTDEAERIMNEGTRTRDALLRLTPAQERDQCARLPHLPERDALNPALPSHQVPTLAITGTYDKNTPVEGARVIVAKLRNARLFEFPGFGHIIFEAGAPCALEAFTKHILHPKGVKYKAPDCFSMLEPSFELDAKFLN